MTYYGGLDLARYRDFSAFVLGQIQESDSTTTLRVVAVKTWPHVDYSVIEDDLCRYTKRYQILQMGVDATNEISFSERLAALALPVNPLRFTVPLKHEMISDVVLFMSQRKVVMPRHGTEELVSQIREQERVISQAGTIRYEHPQGRHDDLFWAFAMMVHVAKQKLLGTLVDYRIYPI